MATCENVNFESYFSEHLDNTHNNGDYDEDRNTNDSNRRCPF